jgi:hypothetical protein
VGGLSHADRTRHAPGSFARGKRSGTLWTALVGRREAMGEEAGPQGRERRGREREAIPGIDPGKRGPRRWASGMSESLPERRAWSPRRSVGGLSHADRAGRALKGGLSPRRPCPVFSPVQGKARGQAGPCPGGEGPPPGEPPEEPGGPPEEGGSSAREAAASGFGGPDLRVVRPAVVVEDAKKRASIALFRDSPARRRAGLISPGRRRESVSIPP